MPLKPETETHLLAHHGDFARFAEVMVETHRGRFDPVFWGFVEKHLSGSPRMILDVGTGPGLLPLDLRARWPEADVVALDGQPEMLRRARDNAKGDSRIHVVEHDLGAPGPLPQPTEVRADLAIASVLIHELRVPTVALDAIAAALVPGGTFIVYDWVRQPLRSYFDDTRPETLDQFTHFSEHCRYTPEDLAWLVEASGFAVCEWMARKQGGFVLLAARRTEASVAPAR